MDLVFPYFADYQRFAAFLDEASVCDCCEETRRCLDATVFYGEETMAAICPDCLSGGQLRGRDLFTCEGDSAELGRQLAVLQPDWPAETVEKAVADKTELLEKTTPPVISWQDWPWPCADGDYCRFIGYGSKALYQRLAGDADAAGLFRRSMDPSVRDETDTAELWADGLPDAEIKDLAASQALATLFYVFESRINGRIVTVWDTL